MVMFHNITDGTTWNMTVFPTDSTSWNIIVSGQQWTKTDIPLYGIVLQWILRLVISLLSIIMNSLTIIAVIKFPNLQEPNNFGLVSLAFADAISIISTALRLSLEQVTHSDSLTVLCKIWLGAGFLSVLGNIWSIFCISAERFIYIKYCLQYYSLVTPTRMITVLCIGWCMIVLLSIFVVCIEDCEVSFRVIFGNPLVAVPVFGFYCILVLGIAYCHIHILYMHWKIRRNYAGIISVRFMQRRSIYVNSRKTNQDQAVQIVDENVKQSEQYNTGILIEGQCQCQSETDCTAQAQHLAQIQVQGHSQAQAEAQVQDHIQAQHLDQAYNQTHSQAHSQAKVHSQAKAHSQAQGQAQDQDHSQTLAHIQAHGQAHSQTHSQAHSQDKAHSQAHANSQAQGQAQAQDQDHSQTLAHSQAYGQAHSQTHSQAHSHAKAHSQAHAHCQAQGQAQAKDQDHSQTQAHGQAHSQAHGHAYSQVHSQVQAQTQSHVVQVQFQICNKEHHVHYLQCTTIQCQCQGHIEMKHDHEDQLHTQVQNNTTSIIANHINCEVAPNDTELNITQEKEVSIVKSYFTYQGQKKDTNRQNNKLQLIHLTLAAFILNMIIVLIIIMINYIFDVNASVIRIVAMQAYKIQHFINPFIYVWTNREWRLAFKILLKIKR